MESGNGGKMVMIFGAVLLIGGFIWYQWGDKLSWIGRLPGDIGIERDNVRIYIPVTTMILISLLLTLIMRLIRNWL